MENRLSKFLLNFMAFLDIFCDLTISSEILGFGNQVIKDLLQYSIFIIVLLPEAIGQRNAEMDKTIQAVRQFVPIVLIPEHEARIL